MACGGFRTVITVCDNAAETCPIFPGPAQRIHWSFADPAATQGSDEAKQQSFRIVRDQIAAQLQHWLATGQTERLNSPVS